MAKSRKKSAGIGKTGSPKRPAAKKEPVQNKAARKRAAVGGPVTLGEAQALAIAQRPQLVAQKATAQVNPVSPATVGAERKKLDQQRKAEIQQRIRDYRATMKIMKTRGVKGLIPMEPGRTERALPLQIFAEGDSWFDYPVPFFGGGIIPRLETRLGVPILNLAKAGDEVRYMLGVDERAILTQQLKKGCPVGGPWDALLFSGGGNDLVGNPMALWVRDYDPALTPDQQLYKARLDAALAIVRAGYEDLIDLRDRFSPTTELLFHAYDFALPDGRGVCNYGPWMKPTFDLRQFPSLATGASVVKAMLLQFAAMLTSLQSSRPRITFINGQGTLVPVPASWANELHPAKAGFNKFADLFQTKIKALFPGRVL